jgi:hypothetical protein
MSGLQGDMVLETDHGLVIQGGVSDEHSQNRSCSNRCRKRVKC